MWRSALLVLTLTLCGANALAAGAKLPGDVAQAVQKFSGTPAERLRAVEFALANTARTPSIWLLRAAAVAQQTGRLEDAAFLYYAGYLRSRLDLERFRPVGEGGNSPAAAIATVRYQVGAAVNPAIMLQPPLFKAAVERLDKWSMATADDYSPGWEHAAPMTTAEARRAAERFKREYVDGLRGVATLLNDPEYFAAFKVVQAHGAASPEERQRPERAAEREAAERRMRAIEEKLDIEGMYHSHADH